MRIGRSIIIPAILALGMAGAALSGPGMSVAAAASASPHVHFAVASSAAYYHG
jgi:hypothetical protein